MENVAQAAARGAVLLDAKNPGWADRIDTEKLDQRDGHVCVLGQLYQGYGAGQNELRLDSREAEFYGFTVKYDYEDSSEQRVLDWEHSTEAWEHEVMQRRGRDGQIAIRENSENVIVAATSETSGAVVITWTDPDETPLEAIARLNREVIELREQPNNSDVTDSVSQALSKVQDVASYLVDVTDAIQSASSAIDDASSAIDNANDYLGEAEQELEQIS